MPVLTVPTRGGNDNPLDHLKLPGDKVLWQADSSRVPMGDYASPGLDIILPDAAFPNMVVGSTTASGWPWLRREIGHNWYVDRRDPTVGFVSRDEALILYNSARGFAGLPCLEVGCWRAWSSVHIALGAGSLEIVDPVLTIPEFRDDVTENLRRAGVLDRVVLHDGASPRTVERLAAETGKRWSFAFIDGDHEGDAPRADAEVVHRFMASDAMIVLHDLTSPHVAAALHWLHDHGWDTYVYQTMQIMGVAVRGSAKPIEHLPDPSQRWFLPAHLSTCPVIGETRKARLSRTVAALEGRAPPFSQEQGESAIDALPPADAAELDLLLTRAANSFAQRDTIEREFDDLQRRYMGLAARLAEREATTPLQQEFETLSQAHGALLKRASDAEIARDQALAERDAAWCAHEGALLKRASDAEIARDQALAERDAAWCAHEGAQADHAAVQRMFDRLLWDFDRLRGEHQDLLRIAQERELAENALRGKLADREALARAGRTFAHWIAQKRILFGLTRRLLCGRAAEVRRSVEEEVRECGFPGDLVSELMWFASPRVIFGLARRRALTDMRSVEGNVILTLERHFGMVPAASATAPGESQESRELRDVANGLRDEMARRQQRFFALEAAKLADEEALLEAHLTIARLRAELATTQA